MSSRRNNATALLQKANSQLRGERIPLKTKDEDELAAYLNSLTLKTQQAKNRGAEEHGDISASSGADGRSSETPGDHSSVSPAGVVATTSKYLKKKPASSGVGSQVMKEDKPAGKSKKESIIGGKSRGSPAAKTEALTRAGRVSRIGRSLSRESVSDNSLRGSDVGQRPGSSASLVGQDGTRFLKNQKTVDVFDEESSRSPTPQQRRKVFQDGRGGRETFRTLGNHFNMADQDSFDEFIHALSTSESSSKQPQNLVTRKQQKWRKKPPSPSSHSPSPVQGSRSPSPVKQLQSATVSRSQSGDFEMMNSMDSDHREWSKSDIHEEHFQINLMDVASLLPRSPSPVQEARKSATKHTESKATKHTESKHDKPKSSKPHAKESTNKIIKTKEKSNVKSSSRTSLNRPESQTSLFESLGVRMADELLDVAADNSQHAESVMSSESEIKTERSEDRRRVSQNHLPETKTDQKQSSFRWSSPERNISEKSETENSADERRSHDVNVKNQYSDQYSDSFISENAETESISHRSRDQKSRSEVSHKDMRRRRSHKIVMEEMQVNVSAADDKGGMHQWNAAHMDVHVSGPYGLQYVDPAPIATTVVSADALEAMTAYSPNMLALHEMMKAQLQLVQNFVDIQHRIYQSCIDGLRYDHRYTTLEDTKKYIRKHRKPHMTFQEALKLTEQEEGIIQT